MKYLVIYSTDKRNVVTRIGPFTSREKAEKIRDEVHPSRNAFLSIERKTLPDDAKTPTPMAYQVILQKEIWLHKGISKLYEIMGKKKPFKMAWIKVEE